MTMEQIIDLMVFLKDTYSNFGDVKEKIKAYEPILKNYDYNDVQKRVFELIKDDRYSLVAPHAGAIVSGLTQISNKIDFEDITWICSVCNRQFATHYEMLEHEDRCRSVRYIVKQYKRFNLGAIDKKFLYELTEEEFQERYKKLLRIVQNRITNEHEKKIIENIFNPPKPEEAKKFLQNEKE